MDNLPQNHIQEVQENHSPPTPKKKLNTVLILLCFFFLLVVFSTGAYYLGSQKQSISQKDTIQTINPSFSPLPTSEVVLSPTLTDEMKTRVASLWDQEKQKDFLKNSVTLKTPPGLTLVDCEDSINFADKNGPKGCGTESSNFIINVFPDSPYRMQQDMNPNDAWIRPTVQDGLTYGGKPASSYIFQSVPNGPIDHKHKVTAIKYDEQTYLYVFLQRDEYESTYQEFLNNIVFK